MKKVAPLMLGFLLLAIPMLALADGPRHHHRDHRYNTYHGPRYPPVIVRERGRNDWIVPALVGGAVVYMITQSNGKTTQAQTLPLPPAGYHYETLADMNCNCTRVVLVPNR